MSTTISTISLDTRPPTKVHVTTLQRIRWIFNTFYYQILATITIVLFWLFFENNNSNSFTTHLVLSTAAYIPLMAVSIILFSEDNVTTLYIPRQNRNWIHGGLLIASALFVTIGIGVETYEKSKAGRNHFTSNHAIFGLISWIFVFVSLLLGVVAANTRSFSTYVRPVVAKLCHNVLGLFAFAMGIASIWEERNHIKRFGLPDDALIGFEWGLIFVSVWSGVAALQSLWRQVRDVI